MTKILHLCLANFYVDGYSYQENILPREHKFLGYDVEIIASTETFINNEKLGYIEPCIYHTEDGIQITRLAYLPIGPLRVRRKIRKYSGLRKALELSNPDIIFIHDVQFFDAYIVRKFVEKRGNIRVYVDCHADFTNSARTFISREILHKLLYRLCAQQLNTITTKFWGTLPSRMDFLANLYRLPRNKIHFLPMGVEDSYIRMSSEIQDQRLHATKSLQLKNPLVLVSGGKIDSFKLQTLDLIDAAGDFGEQVRLIIFGSVSTEIKTRFESLLKRSVNVEFVGWLSVSETCKLLAGADVAIFPGRHSVLWEQCVGMGIPLALKRWQNMHHLDLGGNVIWLDNPDVTELKSLIRYLISSNNLQHLRQGAKQIERFNFSYSNIAVQSVDHKF
jgi:1,2-diacylglycerol 3-alpha-glucosyltransferase